MARRSGVNDDGFGKVEGLQTGTFGILPDTLREETESDDDESDDEEKIQLSSNYAMFPRKKIAKHRNIVLGEISSDIERGSRQCVIKFDPEQINKETNALLKLGSHTNIVCLIDSGALKNSALDITYIVLQKYHDLDLEKYLHSPKTVPVYDVNRGLRFCKQIINGVKFVHEKLIIHKDLKPSNILLSEDLENVRIADFGSSQEINSTKSMVRCPRIFGTLGYRPPESLDRSYVSLKSDVFSLGVVFYFLLSKGRSPLGPQPDLWDYNTKKGIFEISQLFVPNPNATEHLIKSMLKTSRCFRPSIEIIQRHPCWLGQERSLSFDYDFVEEIDDDVTKEDTSYDEESSLSEDEFLKTIKSKEAARILSPADFEDHETPCIKVENEDDALKKRSEMQPMIFVIDNRSRRLCRFDHENKSMMQMHKYPRDRHRWRLSAVSYGDYIYTFSEDRSVYRLEYRDVTATWEQMNDWVGDHGDLPPAVSSTNAIFLVGMQQSKRNTKKSVTLYDPRVDQWKILENKPRATSGSALACGKDYLYCIGGLKGNGRPTARVERMDLARMQWKRVAKMRHREDVYGAAECNENIYTAGGDVRKINFDMYDPNVDQWTRLVQLTRDHSSKILKVFAFNKYLVLVNIDCIHKYDIQTEKLSIIKHYRTMRFEDAVLGKNFA